MTILSGNVRDVAIITVKNVDYCCIIHNTGKSDAINLLKSSVLESFFFFLLFLFSIYKVVDIMDIYKSLSNSIGTIMKNPEIVKFVPDHIKTKRMCKHANKKLL